MLPLVAPLASADGARDANIQVTVTPSAQTINPGEAGEYTVRVYNSGSNAVTVQLSSAEGQDQDCSAYTSTITQITGQIDAGSYEEASMNISLTQTAEGSCETTVTANAQDAPEPHLNRLANQQRRQQPLPPQQAMVQEVHCLALICRWKYPAKHGVVKTQPNGP